MKTKRARTAHYLRTYGYSAIRTRQQALELTSGERLTRVIHAVAVGNDDLAKQETIWLVRRARHEQLLATR